MLPNFGDPLGCDVVEGDLTNDGEAEDEDIRLGIAQRTETVVILLKRAILQSLEDETHLAGRIPESQIDGVIINCQGTWIIVESERDQAILLFVPEGKHQKKPERWDTVRHPCVSPSSSREDDSHCGDILDRKGVRRVGDEHTRLADGSITHNDTFYLSWRSRHAADDGSGAAEMGYSSLWGWRLGEDGQNGKRAGNRQFWLCHQQRWLVRKLPSHFFDKKKVSGGSMWAHPDT